MSFYTRAYNTFEFAVFCAIRSTCTYLPLGPSVSTLCTLALVSDSDTMGTRFHPSGLVNLVAFGYKGEGDSDDLNYTNAYRKWILYSPLYEEPDNSVDFNNVPSEE